jgi:hypothetical protein
VAATRPDNRQEPGTIMGRNRFLPVRNHLDTTKWRKSDGRNSLTTIRVPWPIMRRRIYGIERLSTNKSFMAQRSFMVPSSSLGLLRRFAAFACACCSAHWYKYNREFA